MSHLSILLLLFGIVAHQAWALSIVTMCRGHLSGTLLPNPQDCGSYYVCQSGPQLLLCSDGLHFDRVHKVCNWPDVANCKLEDIEPVPSNDKELEGVQQEKLSENISELEEKTSEKHLADSKEMEYQHAQVENNEEKLSHQEQENLALVSSVENQFNLSEPADNVHIPVQVPTVNVVDAVVKTESSSKSQESGELSSSIENAPQPEYVEENQETSKQNENYFQTLEVHIPVSPIKLPNPVVNEPQAEIVVEEENSSKQIDGATQEVHNPVSLNEILNSIVNETETEIDAGSEGSLKPSSDSHQVNEVHVPVSPNELPNSIENEPEAGYVADKVNSLKPHENVNQVIEVHVPVSPIELPNSVVNKPGGEIDANIKDSLSPSTDSNHVIKVNVPMSPIKVPSSIVNEPEAEIDANMKDNLSPSTDSKQVIIVNVPMSPIELVSSIVNEPEPGYVAEKVISLKPHGNVDQVIEVHVPVSPIELPNSIVNKPGGEIDANIKDSLSPSTDSNYVIKVNVPMSPIELLSSIVNEPEAGYVANKVNSLKPSENENRVIEVHVAESTIELVNTLKPSEAANVIEVLVPVSPIELPNSFANEPDYLVEKVGASSQLDSNNQIIELYVLPEMPETIVSGNDAITGAVVEKVVETPISPENTNKIIGLQLPAFPIDNTIYTVNDPDRIILNPEVEKIESSKPSKNFNQAIDLHTPIEISHWLSNGEISHAIVEKVESKKPGVNPNNVIELMVPEFSHLEKVDREDYNSPNTYPTKISGSSEFTQLSGGNADSSNESTLSSSEEDGEHLLKEGQSSEEDVAQPNLQNLSTNDSSEEDGEHLLKEDQSSEEDVAQSDLQNLSTNDSEDEPVLREDEDSVEEQVDQLNVENIDSQSVEVEKAQSSEVAESLEEQLVHENADKIDSQSVEVESALSEEDENELEKAQSSGEDDSQPILEVSSKDHQNEEKIDSIKTDVEAAFAQMEQSSEKEQNSNQITDQSTEHKNDSAEVNDSFKGKPNVNKTDFQSSGDVQPDEGSILTQSSFSSDEDSLEASSEEEHSGNIKKPLSTTNKDKVVIPQMGNPVKDLTAPIKNSTALKPASQHSSLLVSLLSYATAQGNTSINGTLNRPIIGATDIKTGHPTDVMTGYNSNNVQCIHKGLYFLPHPRDCQKYFICAYSNLHMHTCGNSLIWNYKREQCEFKRDTRCYSSEMMVQKSKRKTTKAPSSTTTTKPARKDNVDKVLSVLKTTPTPMPPLMTTFLPTVTVPVSSVGRAPICPALKQVYLPSFDDCNKYYICILGHPALTSCPDSLHWDTFSQKCAEPAKAQCAGK